MNDPFHLRRARGAGIALAAGLALGAFPVAAQAATVNLGTADAFSVLGAAAVTNTGPSVLTGDLGVSPGSSIGGFPPGVLIGALHPSDAVAAQAQIDTTTAYNDAAGRPSTASAPPDLAGSVLTPGVYTGGSLALNGALTLDAQNDPDAVFVFQAASDLIVGSGSQVLLTRGAQACNVFWQVTSSATIGTTSAFTGNILALASITLNTGASLNGRALARTGAVTLDTNTVTRSACAAAPSPTPTPVEPTSSTPPATTTPSSPSASGGGSSTGATPQAPPASRSAVPTRNGTAILRGSPGSPGTPGTPGSPGSPRQACSAGYSATVRGRQIKRVVFSLDGRRIASRTRSPFQVFVRAAAGRHKVRARVTFKDATRARTLTLGYRACAAAVLKPRRGPARFTG